MKPKTIITVPDTKSQTNLIYLEMATDSLPEIDKQCQELINEGYKNIKIKIGDFICFR